MSLGLAPIDPKVTLIDGAVSSTQTIAANINNWNFERILPGGSFAALCSEILQIVEALEAETAPN